MSEYIRKQDAVEALGEEYVPRTDFERGMVSQLSCDKEKIKSLPSSDVVPVIRCKDCEWAMKSTELRGWYMCKCEEAFDYYAKPDDFCSYGKRREG